MAKKNIITRSKKEKARMLAEKGEFVEAKKLYQQICELDRLDVGALLDLSAIHERLNESDKARVCLKRAAELNPGNATVKFNLGFALYKSGQYVEAAKQLNDVLKLDSGNPMVRGCLGYLYLLLGDNEKAIEHYRWQVRENPSDIESLVNLGNLLKVEGKCKEAIDLFKLALNKGGVNARLYDGMGSALCALGEHAQAIDSLRKAIALEPHNSKYHSNLLMTMQYVPELGAQRIYEEHQNWAQTHTKVFVLPHSYANSRDPWRRLRIGYVSSDFRAHSVAFFFEPLLEGHNPDQVETFCYSGVATPDIVTERLQGLAKNWRNISALSDEQVAELVRADGVDILVDLAGHTGGSRLHLFARKPAPVQVTWLGYPDTTGLTAIDYRLTDMLADPEGQEIFYAEKLERLPGCFLCYKPLSGAPEVVPLPCLERGYVTFGSFNTLPKINQKVVELWAQVLRAVPNSRLFIKTPPLTDGAARERYYGLFEAEGIGRDRVELIGRTATQAEHLELYRRMDIALDTIPYNGTTTTCEAMWMGVPVVTLAGERHSGRVGVSILNAVGMQDWIAGTAEQYVDIAAKMAADIPRLAELRAGLRARLAASPLCDGKSFAQKVEIAYREMWRKFCEC